jgi:hypothetical protein
LTKQPWFNSASRGNEYGLDNFFIQFFPSCPYRFGDRLSQVLRMAGFAEKGAITSLAGFASRSGHFVGRFCRGSLSPEARQPYNNAGRLQVGAGCFSTHTSSLLDAPQRPSELR